MTKNCFHWVTLIVLVLFTSELCHGIGWPCTGPVYQWAVSRHWTTLYWYYLPVSFVTAVGNLVLVLFTSEFCHCKGWPCTGSIYQWVLSLQWVALYWSCLPVSYVTALGDHVLVLFTSEFCNCSYLRCWFYLATAAARVMEGSVDSAAELVGASDGTAVFSSRQTRWCLQWHCCVQ